MKRGFFATGIALAFMFVAALVAGHGGVEDEHSDVAAGAVGPGKEFLLADLWQLVLGPLVLLIIVLIFDEHLPNGLGKHHFAVVIFVIICFVVVSITGYILFDTLGNNILSWSRGPVHWHADLDIVLCGEQRFFSSPTSNLLNRVGTPAVHHHDDMRIHLEGVLMTAKEATLGHFFDAIAVPFDRDRIFEYRNGDSCSNGKPGKVRMFVNGVEHFEFREYIIAPYPDVPPGDRISITFT